MTCVPCRAASVQHEKEEEKNVTKLKKSIERRREGKSKVFDFSFSMNIFSDWRPQTKTLKIIKKVMYVMTQWKTGFGKKLLQNNKICENCFSCINQIKYIKWLEAVHLIEIWGKNNKTWDIFKKNWSGKYNQSQQFYYHFSIYLCILFINLKCPLYHN